MKTPYPECTNGSGGCFSANACLFGCRDNNKYTDEKKALRRANELLVQALDRILDILRDDEFMEHSDIEVHEIVNNALRFNEELTKRKDAT